MLDLMHVFRVLILAKQCTQVQNGLKTLIEKEKKLPGKKVSPALWVRDYS